MKDFVEIQHSVLWKLCFDQSYFWLVKTNTGIRGKHFSTKELNFLPSGNSIFGQCYFAAGRNHYWNKEKTVLRERAHSCLWTTDFPASGNHFFPPFFGDPCQFFFRLMEKYFRANNGFHKQKKSFK